MSRSKDTDRVRDAGNLAWLDLEMTGLDPQRDVIIQAALIVTSRELEPVEEYCCDIYQPDEALARMSPFVRDMHEKNGLIERVRASRATARIRRSSAAAASGSIARSSIATCRGSRAISIIG